MGYEYVVLDDCWSNGRDQDNYLLPDLSRFPMGMKDVGDHIHDLGMLFGMYSSAGEMTCARYGELWISTSALALLTSLAGSLDYEKEDATIFAKWGVDYLKYDNCYHMGRFGTPQISFNRYNAMWRAINGTGRPMLYSLCNWGEDYPHTACLLIHVLWAAWLIQL